MYHLPKVILRERYSGGREDLTLCHTEFIGMRVPNLLSVSTSASVMMSLKLTATGHWVTPATPSAQFSFNNRTPCQWIVVPLKFVRLLCTVTPTIININHHSNIRSKLCTQCVSPVGFNSRPRKLTIDHDTLSFIAIRRNDCVRDDQVILSSNICKRDNVFIIRGDVVVAP